jgi:hypothetical protein
MHARSLILVGILASLSLTFSSVMVSAQGNLTISGTVFARSGSSVQGAAVIACLLKNDACDDTGSGLVQVKGSGPSAKYQLTGLAADEFVMLAWRDLNSNQNLDNGDEVGVYQKSGKATQVKAPAQNIDIRLVQFNGDLEAILQQADEAPAQTSEQPSTPSTSSGGLAFSGTVKALSGSSLDDAIVLAGVWEDGKYNQDKSKGVKVGANGKFSVTGLEKIPYVLFAWRDVDGDSDVSAGDEVAPFKPGNKFTLATPPLSNITLQFEQGDSSLDALVALTVPNANAGANSNDPKATNPKSGSSNSNSASTPASSPGALVKIDCGKKEAFFGDYGCIVPPVDSYLGNTKCPLEAKFPGVKQEKGFFSGYVYDSCSRPMANMQVSLSQYKGGLQTTVRTDSKGFYRVESRYVIGAYVYASAKASVNSNEYDFTVFPANRIYGNDGGIQNIHYNTRDSQVWLYPNFYGFNVPEKPLLEIVLEPVKLFDGTVGKVQRFQVQSTGGNLKLSGVKYGQYNVSAFVITPTDRFRTWLEIGNGGKLERLPVTVIGTDVAQLSMFLSSTGNP